MLQKRLKSKLALVTITRSDMTCGSITIDEDLMDAMELSEFDAVEVNGATVPARIVTYAIKGERGSGIIGINGGASLHFKVGDKIHILCYGYYRVPNRAPIVIHTDENNKIR
jgi:aspartate 1-decarboxylase